MIVVDTNVLSEPLRRQPDPEALAWLRSNAAQIAITAITVAEMLYGIERLPRGRRRDGLSDAAERMIAGARARILSFDEAAARAYAELRSARERAGRPVGFEDTMIAAICLAGGHALATRNTSDFADAGLDLIDPWSHR